MLPSMKNILSYDNKSRLRNGGSVETLGYPWTEGVGPLMGTDLLVFSRHLTSCSR